MAYGESAHKGGGEGVREHVGFYKHAFSHKYTHTHTQVMEAAKAVGEHFIFRIDADLWFANSLALKEILLTELKLHTASLCVECVQGVRVL